MGNKKINICIVHYNTPKLTECLVKSINKFVPNSTICIFDNSDELPFDYRQDNIVYIDNTNGQIINFDEWLNNIPTKVKIGNKYASAKHCYTIQKCMELIDDNFILLDSDVLLKKDITELFDEQYIYVGDVEKWQGNSRVIPYCCFINTKMCKDNGVNYYNENYIVGLTKNCRYDTGAYFWLSCQNFPHKNIKFTDYIVHLDDGSQRYQNIKNHDMWLMRNKSLWSEEQKIEKMAEYENELKAFLKRHGYTYDIDNPKTIQEKIQWLKIHDSTPLKTKCADKIKVHEYCKEKLGEDICIPILKIYNSTDEIKWSELPDSFVLKCNHGSGMNIIVKNKKEVSEDVSKQKVRKWLATDFAFQNGYEMQYHNIERKTYVEKYMWDETQKKSLYDYKFWCFNGIPKFYTINDGFGHGDIMYYDMEHNELNPYCIKSTEYNSVPPEFDKMKEFAKKLSEDFKFVRVDFYYVGGKIYLGELTFTPGSGLFIYKDSKYALKFGEMLNLRIENKKVIYTCITGAYELLDDPFVVSPGYDYVCFTNYDEIQSNVWQIRPIPEELNGLSEVKKQRCIKINPHKYLPEYDFSIWVDGSVKLRKDVNEFVENNCKNSHIFIPTHPARNCIYKEADACIRMKKDTAANIEPQINRYKKEEFPKNFGLVQSNIILRYHNEPDCIKLMETWWEEVKNGSHRDQLSFDYARWKNQDAEFVFIDKNTCNTEYFKWDSTHGKSIRRFLPAKSGQTSHLQKIRRDVAETKFIMKNSEDVKSENKIIEKKKTTSFKTSIPIKTTPVIRRKIITNKLRKFIEQR